MEVWFTVRKTPYALITTKIKENETKQKDGFWLNYKKEMK